MTARPVENCSHCGEPIPPNVHLLAQIQGEERSVCCHGCQMVANLIHGAGLDRYYTFRDALPDKPMDEMPKQADYQAWDREAVHHHYAKQDCDGLSTIFLVLENVHCSACAWLIQRFLKSLPGVAEVALDTSDGRLMVQWDQQRTPLSEIALQLKRLGYTPHLDSPNDHLNRNQAERRDMLKYLMVSGVGMMQVMSYALAGYIGAFQDLDAQSARFFQLVSMLVAVPVALYAGQTFYKSAWKTLKQKRLGMDVPVALAMLVALGASILVTFFGTGETYFDSVVMFIFFLLLGRYAVMVTRQNAGQLHSALARSLPNQVTRLSKDGAEKVGLIELCIGDHVQVGLGETIPCDGLIIEGEAFVDESLLSGESKPRHRRMNDEVLAGTQVQHGHVVFQITHTGQDTTLSHVIHMLDQARHVRPQAAKMADQVAGWFITFVLIGALTAGAVWWMIDPAHALPIMLAILVVSCPCALALGTPVALASAARGFARLGLLINEPDALERFSQISHVVFDKTGTLTQSTMQLMQMRDGYGRPIDAPDLRAIAARLERISRHPIASAFAPFDDGGIVTDAEEIMHQGIRGCIDGVTYFLGKSTFMADLLNQPTILSAASNTVFLADSDGILAQFELDNPIRDGAEALVSELHKQGLEIWLASGDQTVAVDSVASALGIRHAIANCSPEDKLALMHRLQAGGARVMMVGDGINDAPVLAGADVSISLAEGADIARTQADVVLTGHSLANISYGLALAPRVRAIIRQNLSWAIAYNVAVFPLAAVGWIPPWAAAIGMSLSSLVVVFNGRRAGAPVKLMGQDQEASYDFDNEQQNNGGLQIKAHAWGTSP